MSNGFSKTTCKGKMLYMYKYTILKKIDKQYKYGA